MGIGSPRLLTRFVLRSAVVCAAAFGFSPSAYAALGVGAPVPAGGNSASVSVSTSDSTVPAVTASVDVAPATAPKTAVSTQVRPDARPVQATQATVGQATVGQATVRPSHLEVPRVAGTPADRAASPDPGRIRSQARGAAHRGAVSTHVAAPTRTAFTLSPTRGAPSSRTADTTPFRRLTTVQTSPSAGPAPRNDPSFPRLPASLFTSAPGAGGSVAPVLLLFALATVLAGIRAPGLRRRLALALRAPRPYPYLLVLERPD